MKSRARFLFVGVLSLLALPFLGLPAAAELAATADVVPTAPSSNPLTSEDMARSGESYSVYLWIAAPLAVAALWFGFTKLWASGESAHR